MKTVAALAALAVASAQNSTCNSVNLYASGIKVTLLNGTTVPISSWSGQVLLITNVATF